MLPGFDLKGILAAHVIFLNDLAALISPFVCVCVRVCVAVGFPL